MVKLAHYLLQNRAIVLASTGYLGQGAHMKETSDYSNVGYIFTSELKFSDC